MGSDNDEGYASDISRHYIDNDEEKMACNSTDEEEISYPMFNFKTDMKEPKFQLGMLFLTSKIFREEMKNQVILERIIIIQCRNYGRRIRFICEGT